jgi:outer membrane protein TolC
MLKRQTASILVIGLVCGGGTQLCRLINAQTVTQSPPQAKPPLTLDETIRMAESNVPAFAAAAAEARAAALERKDAHAALLPTARYRNEVIYTQPNGQSDRIGQTTDQPAPVFIANNAVREYASQGIFNETLGLSQVGAIRLANANAARANAELEIARRGLVATVVSLFYNVGTQNDKVSIATRALAEADRFVEITQQREQAREAAHADVIKAQIQQQQRQREVSEAKLAANKARLELGVLLFADPATPYDLAPIGIPRPLPDRPVVEAAARANNPELRSALASLHVTEANTYAARAALLPELGINVTYGIDAPQVATNGPDGTKNLGYSGSASLDIPIWDWLTSERKIKETRILQGAAKTAVTAAQRRLLADLSEFYAEATTAQAELASLDRSVLDARESLRLTNLRYTDGEGTVFEVVDAQNTLISAEDSQIDGKVRYQLALAQLQTLTGNL